MTRHSRGVRPTELEQRPASGRDVALVLSGGSVNGVLMELGFLKRLRETSLWPRVGWIFGTSAGALAGCMAALDRLDDLEAFLLALKPEETFRPNRLWRLPLLGLHEYALPQTVARELGDPIGLAEDLAVSERELVVVATDVGTGEEDGVAHRYELVYSSKETPPEEMMQAVFSSAAISALVLPVRVGRRVATDGAWVRNFPLAHAYARPEVELIVAFRYVPKYPALGIEPLSALRRRLERFEKMRVPPLRALIAELREAEERDGRGEPAHLGDMLVRLNRAAIMRNTLLEEATADEKDASIQELAALREDLVALARRFAPPGRRAQAARAVEQRFDLTRFPFGRARLVPRITVRGSVAEVSLEPGLRTQRPWTEDAKRAIIARGYELTDRELMAVDVYDDDAAGERGA